MQADHVKRNDNLNLIIPGLYLGNAFAARNTSSLHSIGVTHVISVMRDPPIFYGPEFVTMAIPIDDWPDEEILCHLKDALDFIQAALANNGIVLVHCLQGASRSASIVAAYLMSTQGLAVSDALVFIKERRPLVSPNPGFVRQLDVYESCGYDLTTERGLAACSEWRKWRDDDYMTRYLQTK